MREVDLKKTVWYNPDYRSCPSGIGFIHKPSGEEVLVTDADCGPRNMEEAKKEIKVECLPTEVEYIPGEFWENRETFGNILKKHGVTHILDVEHYAAPVTIDKYLEELN